MRPRTVEARRSCWICSSSATIAGDAPAGNPSVRNADDGAAPCGACAEATARHANAWQMLREHLDTHWIDIVRRGQVDLSRIFPGDAPLAAKHIHLHFVRLLGNRLQAGGIAVDLESFATAIRSQTPHPDITLMLADARAPTGRLVSYSADVSILRSGAEVHSAMWVLLAHPLAVKICHIKPGAPVLPPPASHPWHPARQRKIVKLSPYRGDTQPRIARRDLRI